MGLLFGSVLNQKQVGGICGALLTNLTAWLSGIWFDLDLVGGVFKTIAGVLPFCHAVQLEQSVYAGEFIGILDDLLWVLGYALAAIIVSSFAFLRQMQKD